MGVMLNKLILQTLVVKILVAGTVVVVMIAKLGNAVVVVVVMDAVVIQKTVAERDDLYLLMGSST